MPGTLTVPRMPRGPAPTRNPFMPVLTPTPLLLRLMRVAIPLNALMVGGVYEGVASAASVDQ